MTDPRNAYADALTRLSRRELLNIAWKLGAAAVIQPIVKGTALAQPALTRYPFTLGVASGDPLPDGVVLWTRLAPDPLNGGGMPMVNVPVRWEIAHDDRFARIAGSGTATARPELGHSVHVEAAGLEAGREYFYRFHAGGDTSSVGRTRTAPAAGAPIDRLRFAVCGCSHFETGYFTAFRHLAAESFDFVFHTGDYIYEGRGNRDRPTPSVRLHQGDEIYTLVDYRNRYAQYKTDPDLLKAHASAPFVVSWDDHEVDNDYAADIDERDTPPEVFLLRRAAAYQAYFESMPLRAPAIPRGPSMTLYRGLAFGNLLDLSVLDTRQYRSDQACGFGAAKDCAAASRTDRTMLGAEQEAWLFARLPQVRATWTVLGQQVPLFARDSGPATGQRFSMDKWDGYTAGRQRLFDPPARNPVAEPDRPVRRRARALRRRLEGRFRR